MSMAALVSSTKLSRKKMTLLDEQAKKVVSCEHNRLNGYLDKKRNSKGAHTNARKFLGLKESQI